MYVFLGRKKWLSKHTNQTTKPLNHVYIHTNDPSIRHTLSFFSSSYMHFSTLFCTSYLPLSFTSFFAFYRKFFTHKKLKFGVFFRGIYSNIYLCRLISWFVCCNICCFSFPFIYYNNTKAVRPVPLSVSSVLVYLFVFFHVRTLRVLQPSTFKYPVALPTTPPSYFNYQPSSSRTFWGSNKSIRAKVVNNVNNSKIHVYGT